MTAPDPSYQNLAAKILGPVLGWDVCGDDPEDQALVDQLAEGIAQVAGEARADGVREGLEMAAKECDVAEKTGLGLQTFDTAQQLCERIRALGKPGGVKA